MCTRTGEYQGLRNVSFSENFAYSLNEWSTTYYIFCFEKNFIYSAFLFTYLFLLFIYLFIYFGWCIHLFIYLILWDEKTYQKKFSEG